MLLRGLSKGEMRGRQSDNHGHESNIGWDGREARQSRGGTSKAQCYKRVQRPYCHGTTGKELAAIQLPLDWYRRHLTTGIPTNRLPIS